MTTGLWPALRLFHRTFKRPSGRPSPEVSHRPFDHPCDLQDYRHNAGSSTGDLANLHVGYERYGSVVILPPTKRGVV